MEGIRIGIAIEEHHWLPTLNPFIDETSGILGVGAETQNGCGVYCAERILYSRFTAEGKEGDRSVCLVCQNARRSRTPEDGFLDGFL